MSARKVVLVGIGALAIGGGLWGIGADHAIRFFRRNASGVNVVRSSPPERSAEASGKDRESRESGELTELLRHHQYRELDAALRFTGTKDPLRWLDWAGTVAVEHRESARNAVLAGWYQTKPDDMLKWAGQNARGFFSSEQFREAAIESGNIADALRGLTVITDESTRARQIEGVFAGLASRDVNQALKAADALAPRRRQAALLGVLRFLAGESPDMALAVADAYSDGTSSSYSLLKATVDSWIDQKGIDCVQSYFSQRPISESLDGGYAVLASSFAVKNPGECGGWLNRISNPARREEATVAVVAQITDSNPEIASRLMADLINSTPGGSNEGMMLARLESTIRPWARKDTPAAFSYIYSLSSLSSPGRNALLQKLALIDAQ
jgi:CRP-like cAMP-binding protein